MTITLGEIAANCAGELRGDGSRRISGVASLAEATPEEISFFYSPSYLSALRRTRAAAVFVPRDFSEEITAATIRVDNPAAAFEKIVIGFAPPKVQFAPGVHPSAVVDASAQLRERVSIQPHAVIEAGAQIGEGTVIGAGSYIGRGVIVGANCLIYPNVTIREHCRLGARVIIHSGAVIGADGFGFEMTESGQKKQPQIGIVQLDDDVEVGANATIDRARFGRTWIQSGTKIDNLVQVAHNVVIGPNSVIAAQTGIAGSARIGQRVMMGGQVGILGHIEVGDDTAIGAQAGLGKNTSGGVWWASPAVPLKDAKVQLALLRRLGEFYERLKKIEAALRERAK